MFAMGWLLLNDLAIHPYHFTNNADFAIISVSLFFLTKDSRNHNMKERIDTLLQG